MTFCGQVESQLITYIVESHINLERVQKRAMRIIFLELTYEQVLESCNISALEERRNLQCINLVNELSREDHKLNHLPPSRKMRVTSRNTRSKKECFYNYPAKTNRFKSSPILYAVNIFNKSHK